MVGGRSFVLACSLGGSVGSGRLRGSDRPGRACLARLGSACDCVCLECGWVGPPSLKDRLQTPILDMLCPVCAECPFANGHSLLVPFCVLHTEVPVCVCERGGESRVPVWARAPRRTAPYNRVPFVLPRGSPFTNDRALDGPTSWMERENAGRSFVDERKCVSAQTGPCPFASATQMGTARLILGNDDVATRNYEAKMSTHSRSPASARLILRSPQVLSPWAAFSRRVGSKREVRLRKNLSARNLHAIQTGTSRLCPGGVPVCSTRARGANGH